MTLEERIEQVCNSINSIFKNNEPERVQQILQFARVIAAAPNDTALEEAIFMVENVIQTGLHSAKVEILDNLSGKVGKRV